MKAITDYEGIYSITKDGRVWSHLRYNEKVHRDDGGYFLRSHVLEILNKYLKKHEKELEKKVILGLLEEIGAEVVLKDE